MLSIVIPTLNEARALPATLDTLTDCDQVKDICIVDGGSQDGTRKVYESYRSGLPQLSWHQSAPGRACQMNLGAQLTTSPWLLFLHADSHIEPGGLQKLCDCLSPDGVEFGCLYHQFSRIQKPFSDIGLDLISRMHRFRFRKTQVVYGDQAMFVHRSLFDKVGGFPDGIMEDVRISERLREHTDPTMLDIKVITDSRKFQQMGVLTAFVTVIRIQLYYMAKGAAPDSRFFSAYR